MDPFHNLLSGTANLSTKGRRTTTLKPSLLSAASQMMKISWECEAPTILDGLVVPLLAEAKTCRTELFDRYVECLALLVTTDVSLLWKSHKCFTKASFSGVLKPLPRAEFFCLTTLPLNRFWVYNEGWVQVCQQLGLMVTKLPQSKIRLFVTASCCCTFLVDYRANCFAQHMLCSTQILVSQGGVVAFQPITNVLVLGAQLFYVPMSASNFHILMPEFGAYQKCLTTIATLWTTHLRHTSK